jgi:hypothetical protein
MLVACIGEEDDDDVEFAAHGLIYTFGTLSFLDATPRGNSKFDYRPSMRTFTRSPIHTSSA